MILWYPISPSRVQFSIWDTAGASWTDSTPLDWGSDKIIKARFYYYQVQCYNDKNEPVDQWPLDQSGIEFAKLPQFKNDKNREKPKNLPVTPQFDDYNNWPGVSGALANSVVALLVLLF